MADAAEAHDGSGPHFHVRRGHIVRDVGFIVALIVVVTAFVLAIR